MSLDAATIKLLLAKESLARKAADLNLRRYAIMQSVIDNHNNKRKMDRDEAAKVAKKGVCPFFPKLLQTNECIIEDQ